MTMLVLDKARQVYELAVERSTSDKLEERFEELAERFLGNKAEIPYEPGYSPSDDEILTLTYDLPPPLAGIRTSLPTLTQYTGKVLSNAFPAALVSVRLGRAPVFRFQAVSSSDLLRPKKAILWGNGDFRFNKQSGIIPRNNVDALYAGGNLYFRSEMQVRRFLDIEEYFHEATDNDIVQFFNSSAFSIEDVDAVKAASNSVMRRKLARLIRKSTEIEVAKLKTAAKRSGIHLEMSRDAIKVPTERKRLRELIDLMSHAYVQSLYQPEKVFYAASLRPLVSQQRT